MSKTNIIIKQMDKWITEKVPISPSVWVDMAAKLNIFIGDDNELLYDLESKVARMENDLINEYPEMAVNKITKKVRATDEFNQFRKQEAKVKQIQEFIRIAKKYASIVLDEIKGY